jgi:hypothetical protein
MMELDGIVIWMVVAEGFLRVLRKILAVEERHRMLDCRL